MATKNDITDDALITRLPSEAYKNNYDLIFRKGNPKEDKNGSTTQPTSHRDGETENPSKRTDWPAPEVRWRRTRNESQPAYGGYRPAG